MKKSGLFLVFVSLSLTLLGQDIIISFSGYRGHDLIIPTVEVVNLSSGNCETIEVPAGSSLNLSTGYIITSINELENMPGNLIRTYPNPFASTINIEFCVPQNENITISVIDIAGKLAAKLSRYMTPGIHSCEFRANNSGIYYFIVSGTDFVQTSKIICTSYSSPEAQLTYKEQLSERFENKTFKSETSNDFFYTVGDVLKLKGIAGSYTTVMTVIPESSTTYTFNFYECTDYDSNNYAVVRIGNQTWMAENLNNTHYQDGQAIPTVNNNSEWAALENNNEDKAYCYYNTPGNAGGSIYGALYTYAAATNGNYSGDNVQGPCPLGWHLPNNNEWTTMINTYLGGVNEAGGKIKSACSSLWNTPNVGATNESGFSALPGGYRNFITGTSDVAGDQAHFWTSTQSTEILAYYRFFRYSTAEVLGDYSGYKGTGFSVRCIMD